jgi:hypothetical protein
VQKQLPESIEHEDGRGFDGPAAQYDQAVDETEASRACRVAIAQDACVREDQVTILGARVADKSLALRRCGKVIVMYKRTLEISPECKDLLERLLRHNPADRISWEDFFEHPWLQGVPSIASHVAELPEAEAEAEPEPEPERPESDEFSCISPAEIRIQPKLYSIPVGHELRDIACIVQGAIMWATMSILDRAALANVTVDTTTDVCHGRLCDEVPVLATEQDLLRLFGLSLSHFGLTGEKVERLPPLSCVRAVAAVQSTIEERDGSIGFQINIMTAQGSSVERWAVVLHHTEVYETSLQKLAQSTIVAMRTLYSFIRLMCMRSRKPNQFTIAHLDPDQVADCAKHAMDIRSPFGRISVDLEYATTDGHDAESTIDQAHIRSDLVAS